MNPDLEALVLALDAVIQARGGNEAERLDTIYQAQLDKVLVTHPALSRERLARAVDFAYWKWRRAQEKRATPLPPTA